jgi:hypothetical protein
MRLTIIVETQTVGKNGLFYDGLDLSSCGIPIDIWALQWNDTSGHIEFNTPISNEDIQSLPGWANACVEQWDARDYAEKNPPPPTPEQVTAANKSQAEQLLMDSDWSVLPDVSLANKADWEAYRASLRAIAISPSVDPVWPVKPESVWQ